MATTAEAKAKVAVVSGGNRGIGFEVCRQLARRGFLVVLAARDEVKGAKAARELAKDGEIAPAVLDVTDPESIRAFAGHLRSRFGRIDVLVNNAGVFLDAQSAAPSASSLVAPVETLRRSMETNVYGPFLLIQAVVPLMQEGRGGRIINMSSGMGQLSDMNGSWPGYRISKTALNALTRIFSEELRADHITVNSVCPGWVRTDMGGREAPRTTEQGADTVVWLATHAGTGPTGQFFRDRTAIPW